MQSNITVKELATDERVALVTTGGLTYIGTVARKTSGRLDVRTAAGALVSLRRGAVAALRSLDRNN